LAREATIHSFKKTLLNVQLKRKTRCKETFKSISSKKTQPMPGWKGKPTKNKEDKILLEPFKRPSQNTK
jgi:hypothetical protein